MKFMLLMRGDPAAFEAMPASSQQDVVATHRAWAESLGQAGKLLDGAGFAARSVTLAAAGEGLRVSDGSLIGNPQAPSGFYTVEAADWDEATALARQCPALGFGESVEVLHLAH